MEVLWVGVLEVEVLWIGVLEMEVLWVVVLWVGDNRPEGLVVSIFVTSPVAVVIIADGLTLSQ